MYLWRAVDSEGEVLDVLVQPRRDNPAILSDDRGRWIERTRWRGRVSSYREVSCL